MSTIPDLIRAALGDEVEIEGKGHRCTVDGLVRVNRLSTSYSPAFGFHETGVELRISGYASLGSKTHSVFRRVMLKDGQLDLDKFRAKYQEVIEAWKPHQEAIDARKEQLNTKAEVKAQRERYADAGPELVTACKEAISWILSPNLDRARKSESDMIWVLKVAIAKTVRNDSDVV